MNLRKMLLGLMVVLMYWTLSFAQDTISWDFEDGNDHGFTLRCQIPATPAPDDPDVAGDESITGVWGDDGLPGAGVAWTIGPPDMFDGLEPAVFEGCHCETGILEYDHTTIRLAPRLVIRLTILRTVAVILVTSIPTI